MTDHPEGWTHSLRSGALHISDPDQRPQIGPHNRVGQDVDMLARDAAEAWRAVMGDRRKPDLIEPSDAI